MYVIYNAFILESVCHRPKRAMTQYVLVLLNLLTWVVVRQE